MAVIELIVAAAFFIPVLIEYINTGLVLRFPTLIVCGFVVIAAFLSYTSGVILQTMIHKDRQAFEFRLQMTEDMYKNKINGGK